jgi:hypothetical protein
MAEELSDIKKQLKAYETLFFNVQRALGDQFQGDLSKSIRKLVESSRDRSSWNPFRRSKTKNFEKEDEEPIHVIITSLQKQLHHEKHLRTLEKKQLETLKETLRHLEFERNIGSNEMTFKSFRALVLDLFKHLPLQ